MRKHWLIIVGLVLIAAGVGGAIISSNNSEVLNDPSIGGGVLFMLGLLALIAGLINAWTAWRAGR